MADDQDNPPDIDPSQMTDEQWLDWQSKRYPSLAGPNATPPAPTTATPTSVTPPAIQPDRLQPGWFLPPEFPPNDVHTIDTSLPALGADWGQSTPPAATVAAPATKPAATAPAVPPPATSDSTTAPTPTSFTGGGLPLSPNPDIAPLVATSARKNGVPQVLLNAVLQQESSYGTNPAAHGNIGQITFSTAARPGYGIAPLNGASDITDPAKNIEFATQYLKKVGEAGGVTDWNDPTQWGRALRGYNGTGDPDYVEHVARYLPKGTAIVDPGYKAPHSGAATTPAAPPPGPAPVAATAPVQQPLPYPSALAQLQRLALINKLLPSTNQQPQVAQAGNSEFPWVNAILNGTRQETNPLQTIIALKEMQALNNGQSLGATGLLNPLLT